ncbi:ABC transporter permease [Rummeliibacillus suwonensis]|uniref:ABC transporter permease n=1 Tax=Rummeliibacillus suwonensis TaxID=1306154 RepID=UPI0011B672E9|nr:ABC transporter permease [Rummeliibacillus suwonensis]MBO2534795.1 ABC transporter permease [Rummeliibacillus suwonensis]
MLKLLQNEWMKLWNKKGTWVMFILLILAVFAVAGIYKWVDHLETENWKTVEQQSIKEQQQSIDAGGLTKEELKDAKDSIQISNYRLKNNEPPIETDSAEAYLDNGSFLLALISLFGTIIGASIVSNEFSAGTIKMLLTRPISRAKILTSKLLTVFIFVILMAVLSWVLNFIMGIILYGFASGTDLVMEGNKIVESSPITHSLYMYLLSMGEIFMSVIFAFMIGSIFRSSSLAIGLTLFINFMGSSLVVFLSKYEFVKYLWIANTDLTQFESDYSIVEGLTMPFSLTILAVYAVIFLVASFVTFIKRDVTA